MDPGLTGVNRINMTGNANDKLEKRKVEKSVKRTKSHIMNNLLTSFARSARESICSRDFCTKILGNYFSVYRKSKKRASDELRIQLLLVVYIIAIFFFNLYTTVGGVTYVSKRCD